MRQAISFFGLTFASASAWSAEGFGAAQHATPLWVWICVGAAAVVFGAIVYSVVTYQAPLAADSGRSENERKASRELVWASVPIAIVIAAALPSLTGTAQADHLATVNQTVHSVELCMEAAKNLQPSPLPRSNSDLPKVAASSCTAQR
jgi:heme/copper-type cytochrome/quinol oxidase subunit 2